MSASRAKVVRPSAPQLAKAVGESTLDPSARHVFRVLKDRMNFKARAIPADRRPSLTDIEGETGYARSTVREALFRLEEAGWITRFPPTPDEARRTHARTRYELHEPGSEFMQHIRGKRTGPDHRQRRREAAERIAKARERNRAGLPDWTRDRELVTLARERLQELAGPSRSTRLGRPWRRSSAASAPARYAPPRPVTCRPRSIGIGGG